MISEQRGVGMLGFIIIAIVLVLVAIGGMKIGPAYVEFFKVKKAVVSIVASGEVRNATVTDVRRAFDKRAQVDDISVITSTDLEVTKEGGDVVISFGYVKKVPLVANVSVLFDFAGSSKD